MKFAITGGGTGGHLAIAKALQEALVIRGHEAIFIGSTAGQDRSWFGDKSGFSKSYFLETTGVVNRRGLAKIAALFRVLKAMFNARKLLKAHKIQAVISVGGFSAAPTSLATIFSTIPLYIHEQNAVEGRLNRLLKPYAKAFFSSYDESAPVKDYPVNATLFKTARVRSKVKTVIFLGGSQGAKAINDLALSIAPFCHSKHIKIIHQCGVNDYERIKESYKALGIGVHLFAFSNDLPKLMQEADLAITRSGASTLWEVCANALPAFFVPYPYAAGDHQFYNARFIVQKELGWCEREDEDLEAFLKPILDEDLSEKSTKLKALSHEGGAQEIIKYVESEL